MALQLRRGINSQRATTPLAPGELVYVTDNLSAQVSPLYIGDGSTTGGVPVVRVVSVNGETGSIALDTNDIPEGATNKYYLAERAQDDVAAALVAGVHTGITFTYNTTPQDSGNRIDAVVSASGTVNSGAISTLPFYSATGTVLSSTTALRWNNSTNTLTNNLGTLILTSSTGNRAHILLSTNVNSPDGTSIIYSRSRGTELAPTTLILNDVLGTLGFNGYDGDQYIPSAKILAAVNGTVANNIVPTVLEFFTTDTNGILNKNARILNTGQTVLGPLSAGDTGTGSLRITSTVNSGEGQLLSAVHISSHFAGADAQNFAATRSRGTFSAPTAAVSGDEILDMSFFAYDGTTNRTAVRITPTVDGAVSSGITPGALNIFVTNTSGGYNLTAKIYNNTGTADGKLDVTGTVNASVAIKTGVFADATARNTAIPTPSVGMIIFNTATGKFEGNTDGTTGGWVALN
jgi:hypothetical protein